MLAPPFPPMRVLEVQWSQTLNLMCEVAFSVGDTTHVVYNHATSNMNQGL
jgi:hypothetical protein